MLFKKNNKKGFTLMEMLIVVAIIAILVAIMIPTFNSQLEKAREAADIANIRAAYAEATVNAIDAEDGTATVKSEAMTQGTAGWDKVDWPAYLGDNTDCQPEKGDYVWVTVSLDADTASCTTTDPAGN